MSRDPELGWFVSRREWWLDPRPGFLVEDSYVEPVDRLPPVVLLSPDRGLVSGVAFGRRAGRSDSFQLKVQFSDWITFQPFAVYLALEGLGDSSRYNAETTVEGSIGRFTPAVTSHILAWLRANVPDIADIIQRMFESQFQNSWLNDPYSDAAANYAEQLDGLRMALDIAGFDRATAFDKIQHPDSPDNLQLASVQEDQIVINDVRQFLDWPNIPSVVTGAVFEDPNTGRRLVTYLANRLPIEQQTGADVIYYLYELNSFVLVQYKRCRYEHDNLKYRLDSHLFEQIDAMNRLQALNHNFVASCLEEYRIGPEFCFIKICEPRQPLGAKLSLGKYFNLTNFSLAIERGPRGGMLINYQNVERYLTNSLFADLVSQGWVGSSAHLSNEIMEIMENSLDNDRSVLLAGIHHGRLEYITGESGIGRGVELETYCREGF